MAMEEIAGITRSSGATRSGDNPYGRPPCLKHKHR